MEERTKVQNAAANHTLRSRHSVLTSDDWTTARCADAKCGLHWMTKAARLAQKAETTR